MALFGPFFILIGKKHSASLPNPTVANTAYFTSVRLCMAQKTPLLKSCSTAMRPIAATADFGHVPVMQPSLKSFSFKSETAVRCLGANG
jgi:hypothetical protein